MDSSFLEKISLRCAAKKEGARGEQALRAACRAAESSVKQFLAACAEERCFARLGKDLRPGEVLLRLPLQQQSEQPEALQRLRPALSRSYKKRLTNSYFQKACVEGSNAASEIRLVERSGRLIFGCAAVSQI